MDMSTDQWRGRTAGRPRGTANGSLRGAGLSGLSFLLMSVCVYLLFINERVCVRGAETLMGVPQPWSSSIGGVWDSWAEPQSLEGLGCQLGLADRRVGAKPLPTVLSISGDL